MICALIANLIIVSRIYFVRTMFGLARKRNHDEDAKEGLYSLVIATEIPATGLKGLGTKINDDED
ncbi:putative ribosomal protein L31e [Helianthus debilis subsp. tardiflorus]